MIIPYKFLVGRFRGKRELWDIGVDGSIVLK
jgi:hypothetical protein